MTSYLRRPVLPAPFPCPAHTHTSVDHLLLNSIKNSSPFFCFLDAPPLIFHFSYAPPLSHVFSQVAPPKNHRLLPPLPVKHDGSLISKKSPSRKGFVFDILRYSTQSRANIRFALKLAAFRTLANISTTTKNTQRLNIELPLDVQV